MIDDKLLADYPTYRPMIKFKALKPDILLVSGH